MFLYFRLGLRRRRSKDLFILGGHLGEISINDFLRVVDEVLEQAGSGKERTY